jgi:hypothetical protein
LSIVEILAFTAAKADIVADSLKDTNHLLVEMASVHGEALTLTLGKEIGRIPGHVPP